MIDIAYAMGKSGASQGVGGGFMGLMPIILMFAIFYFLLIRPQQKKTKQQREMIDNLKKGDRVITSGGICGHITAVEDSTITVEIADRVRIKLTRSSISALSNQQSGKN